MRKREKERKENENKRNDCFNNIRLLLMKNHQFSITILHDQTCYHLEMVEKEEKEKSMKTKVTKKNICIWIFVFEYSFGILNTFGTQIIWTIWSILNTLKIHILGIRIWKKQNTIFHKRKLVNYDKWTKYFLNVIYVLLHLIFYYLSIY